MIIHQLIAHHLRHGDDAGFYELQAADAVRWLRVCGVEMGPRIRALDLGCGQGTLGRRLAAIGCQVVYADESNFLPKELEEAAFVPFRIGQDPLSALGEYDLVIFSNVLEHIPDPRSFIREVSGLLRPWGVLYLSWTNWLSPWGGHDFAPFHYLGPRRGPEFHERWRGRRTIFQVGKDLFPTHVGRTLRWIRAEPELQVVRRAPRYYPELAWLVYVPILREFLCWNVALLVRRRRRRGEPPLRASESG
jgi:SAM-dependent methyltransferase